MWEPRAGRKRVAARSVLALSAFLCSLTLIHAQEEPAPKDAPPAQRPAGNGLGNLFQRMLQQIWEKPEQPVPRVRVGDNVTAERASGPQDAIDARAPRNPKLDGLWIAANTAIRQSDWKRAAELLQRILDSPEDAVYRARGGRWESLRTAASRQLGQAPPEILADYEQQYRGLADQLYTEARQAGRIDALVDVATRFLHTPAGIKAADYLAHWHFDRAEFALAVRWFAELEAMKAPVSNDIRWRIKAAYAARQASPDLVKTFLTPALSDPRADAVIFGGRNQQAAAGWAALPGFATQPEPVLTQWPQLFGTASRRGIAAGNPPLLKPEWTVPLTMNTALQRRLEWILQDLEDQQETPLMVGLPLALGDKVAFRDLQGVRVIDARSGQTQWTTYEGLSPERILTGPVVDHVDEDFPGGGGFARQMDDNHSGPAAGLHPLVSHLFRDATIGLISADHQHLYVLEDVATMTRGQGDAPWMGDDEPVDPFHANWQSNRLTAYVLATGRRAWSIGGGEGRDLQNVLQGGFFLGAPVADGDDLFAVAALGEEVRLLALDPASGALKWSQLLAYADTKIDLDVARRWVSTPIAVDQGIIVCPTTVGWLVAVDRVRHSVLWAYRYLPEEEGERQDAGEEGSALLTPRELNDQWLATPPVMTGSYVVFTPSDGDVLVCLDLTQGRLVWQEDRDDGLYLAGVTQEQAIVVGQSAVTARRLSDGKVAWSHDWDEGLSPNGRSVIVGDQLYVPLSDGTLRLIALASGEETQKLSVWPGQPALGGLVKAGRRLFSYGSHGLQMFDEQPGVLAEIQELKAANPDDEPALIREAELWLLAPRYADAARQLLNLSPDGLTAEWSERRHVVLWQSLVGLIQTDPQQADRALQDLARNAITSDEKLSVELFRIDRQIQQGHVSEAFDAYWQLAEQDDGPVMIVRPHEPQLKVRRRTWLQGRLHDLWHAAEGDLREQLDQRVEAAVTTALADPLDRRVKLIQWCDFHPAAARLHWKLAEEFALVRDFGVAEQFLLPWSTYATPAIARETQWRLAVLYRQFGLTDDAAVIERQLRPHAGELTLSTGQRLSEALAQRSAEANPANDANSPEWDQSVLVTQLVGTQFAPPVQEVPSPVHNPFLSQLLIQVETNEQRLTFADRHTGKWKWLAPLRGSPRAEDYGEVPTAIVGHSVVLLHKGALQRLSPVDQKLMWSRTLEAHHDDSSLYHTAQRMIPQALHRVSADDGDHEALYQASVEGHLTAVWPGYVSLQGRRSLTVYEPLSGQERWTREGLSPHALVFPTRDYLCVMDMAEERSTLYRASDGQPVEAANLEPRLRRTLRWHGNDLIQLEAQAGLRLFNLGNARTVIRKTDVLTGRDLWRQDFATRTEVGILDDDWLIAVDPLPAARTAKRGVTLVRCEDGERRTLAPLALNVSDAEFFPIADAERVYLVANHGDGNTYHYGDSLTTLPVNGTVCCWDRTTGELLWTREVADQNLVLERFAPLPVLLFLTRNWKQRGNSSFTLLNLLAVEKRTGKILHESSTPSPFGGFHSLTLREQESTIELTSYNQKLRLIPQRTGPSTTNPPPK